MAGSLWEREEEGKALGKGKLGDVPPSRARVDAAAARARANGQVTALRLNPSSAVVKPGMSSLKSRRW